MRKRHILSFSKERTHAFLYRKKSIKRTASLRLDRSCGWQRFDGGYERRRPRSLRSRDPSTAAPFASIAPDGAHTARALRLRARASQAAVAFRTVSGGLCELREHCNIFEPWVYAPQQKHESPRRSLGESFGAFLLSEKSTYLSPLKRRNVFFSCTHKKRTKRNRERTVRSFVQPAMVRWRL